MENLPAGEDLRGMGNDAFKRGDYKWAAKLYERCGHDDASALSNLSLCLLKLGRGKEALAASSRAAELRPEWAKAWMRKAAAHRVLGDFGEALAALERGLEAEPENRDLAKERDQLRKEAEKEGYNISDALGKGVRAVKKTPGSSSCPPGDYLLEEGGKNLLVLLHGLGDTDTNFIEFGRRLKLPDTSLLAIRGPFCLPLGMGRAWFPAFEDDGSPITGSAPGERRRLDGVESSSDVVREILEAFWDRGYEPRRSFLLGFSQGAVIAVNVGLDCTVGELGGVLALSGSILHEGVAAEGSGGMPMLVTHGTGDDVVPIEVARSCFAALECHLERGGRGVVGARWSEYDKGHATPNSEQEVRDIMEFLAPLMAMGNPMPSDPDVVEVTDPALIRSVLFGNRNLAGGGD